MKTKTRSNSTTASTSSTPSASSSQPPSRYKPRYLHQSRNYNEDTLVVKQDFEIEFSFTKSYFFISVVVFSLNKGHI